MGKSIQVVPARNVQTAPYGAAASTVFWSVKGWVDSGDEHYDYAAIVIPSPIGNRTGWFGFGVIDDGGLVSTMANIAGYGGQSGAAVYIIRDKKRIGVAVHAYGGPVTNSGTRISPPVFENLMYSESQISKFRPLKISNLRR